MCLILAPPKVVYIGFGFAIEANVKSPWGTDLKIELALSNRTALTALINLCQIKLVLTYIP